MSTGQQLAGILLASFFALPFLALAAWAVCWVLDRTGLLPIRDIGRAVIILVVAYIAVNALIMVGSQTEPRASEDERIMQQVNEAPDVPQP